MIDDSQPANNISRSVDVAQSEKCSLCIASINEVSFEEGKAIQVIKQTCEQKSDEENGSLNMEFNQFAHPEVGL